MKWLPELWSSMKAFLLQKTDNLAWFDGGSFRHCYPFSSDI